MERTKLYKLIILMTEVPIMVFLGGFLGYEVGRKLGDPHIYLALGAFFGLLLALPIMARLGFIFKQRKRVINGD